MNFLKYIIGIQFIFLSCYLTGQTVFEQDIVCGGVTAAGFSTCSGSGTGLITIDIAPGSTIKKAWLFGYRIGDSTLPMDVNFNTVSYNFNEDNQISPLTNNNNISAGPNFAVHAVNVTNSINSVQNNYQIEVYPQINGQPCLNCRYGCFYLVVIYENLSLPKTGYSLLINDQDNTLLVNYSVNGLNPIDLNFPVSLAIHSDRIGLASLNDGSILSLNGNLLGTLSGPDQVNDAFGCGVKGHFNYNNNQLYGLDDDTADNIISGDGDGLVDINGYLVTNNSFNFDIQYEHSAAVNTNFYLSFPVVYTPFCDTFSVTVSQDTSICQGTQLQLSATGGSAYYWTASPGSLSCTDCPNPVFTGDSSELITVRVWNNDSCSVVRPIKVNVFPEPKFSFVSLMNNTCGDTVGEIHAQATDSTFTTQYALNSGNWQPQGNFTGLTAGNYTVSILDTNGCTNDSLVQITDSIATDAYFTANPTSGTPPLPVLFDNQSTHATDYTWSINGQNFGSSLGSFTFDTSGVYTITLVAWNNNPLCADTFSLAITVFDSLIYTIPNVFSPNGDGINDFFGITVNRPTELSVTITNRWGNIVVQSEKTAKSGFNPLWDGTENSEKCTDGTYFYVIRIEEELKQGFVELRR